MLVCSEPFLNVTLCKRARRDAAAARPNAEPVESRFGQAETKWLRHVANGSACRYDQRCSNPRACSPNSAAARKCRQLWLICEERGRLLSVEYFRHVASRWFGMRGMHEETK